MIIIINFYILTMIAALIDWNLYIQNEEDGVHDVKDYILVAILSPLYWYIILKHYFDNR